LVVWLRCSAVVVASSLKFFGQDYPGIKKDFLLFFSQKTNEVMIKVVLKGSRGFSSVSLLF